MGGKKGITFTDGILWQDQRNFAIRHLRNLGLGKLPMETLIIEELQDFVRTIEEGKIINTKELLAPCVLNVLWALTAGQRFSSADPNLIKLLDLMARRSKAFDMAGGVLNQFPVLAYIASEWSGYNLICSLNKELKIFLEVTINEHKRTLDKTKTRDFIDAFLHEMEITNSQSTSFTEDQLIAVCLDFFIAGSQTTSNTLSFAFLNMILHQDVQEKAYEEIKKVLGDRRMPSLKDRQRLPYVEAVILESQRFLHVVPVAGPRRTISNKYLDKYHIPKNTTVLLSLYSMHHDEALWENPFSFNPNRFLEKKAMPADIFQFGLGKRRCPGESLAQNFLFLFFTGIIRNFHLTARPDQDPPTFDYIPGITLSPVPHQVHFSSRS